MASENRVLQITMAARDQTTPAARKISEGMRQLGAATSRAMRTAQIGARAATTAMRTMGRVVTSVLKPIALIGSALGVLSGASLIALVKGAADAGDAVEKMAQRLGVSAESLSALRFQAELSGTSFEAAATGYRTAARNLVAASQGTGEATDALRLLEIEIKDASGALRSVDAVTADVADRFRILEDGTLKTAIAQRIFGRAGVALIPLLNAGGAGMRTLAADAERLGIVIDGKTAKSAAAFNDSLTRLKASIEGLRLGLASEFFGELTTGFNGLADRIADNREAIIDWLRVAVDRARATGEFLIDVFGELFKFISQKVIEYRANWSAMVDDLVASVRFGADIMAQLLSGVVRVFASAFEATVRALPSIFADTFRGFSLKDLIFQGDAFASIGPDLQRQFDETIASIGQKSRRLTNLTNFIGEENTRDNPLRKEIADLIALAEELRDKLRSPGGGSLANIASAGAADDLAKIRSIGVEAGEAIRLSFSTFVDDVGLPFDALGASFARLKARFANAGAKFIGPVQKPVEALQFSLDESSELARKISEGLEAAADSGAPEAASEIAEQMTVAAERAESWADAIRRIGRENPAQGFALAFADESASINSRFADITEAARDTASNMQRAFADNFFSAMQGNFASFGEGVRSLFTDIVSSIQRQLADLLSSQVVSGLSTIFSSLFGGAPGTPSAFNDSQSRGLATFATGGVVAGPTRALIGEAGMSEAVVPLPDGRSIPVQMQGGGGTVVNINVQAIDGQSVGAFFRKHGDALIDSIAGAVSGSQSKRRSMREAIS